MLETVVIVDGARAPVAPVGGAFKHCLPHELGAPVLRTLLARNGVPPEAVDAVVLGNALGAGGNPARLLALAGGLRLDAASYSVDTQCCAGLDAMTLAVGLLRSGQASVVLAGGVEAWSRSPIRLHRPRRAGEEAQAYERPAFVPAPMPDPDLLLSAARHAARQRCLRESQEHYALLSHERAWAARAGAEGEIIEVAGVSEDAYPRRLSPARARRLPTLVRTDESLPDATEAEAYALSTLTVSPKADGAALVLLASPEACDRWGLPIRAYWRGSVSIGAAPDLPMRAAAQACQRLLAAHREDVDAIRAWSLHDAFAVQGLDFCETLGLSPSILNPRGGGLARGHPIGASGAIALVNLLACLQAEGASGDRGVAAVAGAGGLGAAVLIDCA